MKVYLVLCRPVARVAGLCYLVITPVMFATMNLSSKLQGKRLESQLSGRMLAWSVGDLGFDSQHLWKKSPREKNTKSYTSLRHTTLCFEPT